VPRDLAAQLSCRYPRVVARDNTVRLGPRMIPLPRHPHGRSIVGTRVTLHECVDGRLLAVQPSPGSHFALTPRRGPNADRARRLRASRNASDQGGRSLPLPPKAPSSPLPLASASVRRRPASSHPWRHSTPYSRRARPRPLTPPRGDIFIEQLSRHFY
jgi:hypothetical protein